MNDRLAAVLLIAFSCLPSAAAPVAAQRASTSPDRLWQPLEPNAASVLAANPAPPGEEWKGPPTFHLYTLDPGVLNQILAQAAPRPGPQSADENESRERVELTIPQPNGKGYARFWIEESQILAPELAAKFPEIKTFRGQGIDDPNATVQVTMTPDGFHAQVLTGAGAIIVDPFRREANVYAAYDKAGVITPNRFDCQVRRGEEPPVTPAQRTEPQSAAGALRVYRLAVAATGEYTAVHGGTVIGALGGIANTVARVSGIYERELSIQLQLVANNDRLIFTSAASDPFNNGNANVLIGQSQTEIDRILGQANYDIGHTFSTGAGGLAGLGVACRAGQKARGVTGRTQPFGDAFDVDFVAHEIGHQFGADHSFNGALGNCEDNRNESTAFEPGSGSTIQGYAGICEDDDLQPNSDPYFHSVSLEQILAYTREGLGNCASRVATGNRPPTVDAGQDRTIPKDTPFTLPARGMDPDNDPLTYCWEERDLGPQARVNATDDGKIPLFRSLEPSSADSRTFPRLADLLAGNTGVGEAMPLRDRNFTFRVTARDNRSRGGETASDDVMVKIHSGAGPFRVTAPSSGAVAPGTFRVTWDVAATDRPPVGSGFVNILLSTDGGEEFVPLVTNTRNDGSETVDLPSTPSAACRIRIESADNVFFALSPNFRIQPRAERAAP